MLYLSIKDRFINELKNHFDKKVKIEKRVRVVADLEMFRYKEDPFVWGQKRDKLPKHFMVYFDDQHITTFGEHEDLKSVLLGFWIGFKQAYEKKLVRLTPPWLREVEEKAETPTEKALRKLKKIKPKTKAERMAKEIVKNVIEKK